jgi:hypothetical protein
MAKAVANGELTGVKLAMQRGVYGKPIPRWRQAAGR